MEEATAGMKAITEFGILIVIAGIFLLTYWYDKKEQRKKDIAKEEEDKLREKAREEREKELRLESLRRDDEYRSTIKLLADSTNNVAKALDLLREAEANTTTLIRSHDQRSIDMKEDIATGFGEIRTDLTEVKTIVRSCGRK